MSSLSAYDLFRAGNDTIEIARILRISEALALEQLSRERSARLGKSDPYERELVGRIARPKVKYLGR